MSTLSRKPGFERFETVRILRHCALPQDAGTPLLLMLQIFNLSINSIAVLENVFPAQGYRKELPFPH
jgi:hypothetical protein